MLNLDWLCNYQLFICPNSGLIKLADLLAHLDLVEFVDSLQSLRVQGWVGDLLRLEQDFGTNLILLQDCDVLFVEVDRTELEIVSQGDLVSFCVIQEFFEQILVFFY